MKLFPESSSDDSDDVNECGSVDWGKTSKGRPLAIAGGYTYVKNALGRRDKPVQFFDCQFRKKLHCPGRITVSDDNTYTTTTTHNHEGQCHANQVAASKFHEKVMDDAPRLDIETPTLVSESYDKLSADVKALLPLKRSLVKMANRKQAKGRAKIPKEARELIDFGMHCFKLICMLFLHITIHTVSNLHFLSKNSTLGKTFIVVKIQIV